MVVPANFQSITSRHREYVPRDEPPTQIIEGFAFESHGEAERIGGAYLASREHDRLHDDAADLCERAILAGDAKIALRAIRAVKHYDAAEDAALDPVPTAAAAIQSHARVIASTALAIEQSGRGQIEDVSDTGGQR